MKFPTSVQAVITIILHVIETELLLSCKYACLYNIIIILLFYDNYSQYHLQESLSKDKTRHLYGTAPWTAPELLRGENAKLQSDIW